MIFILFNFTQLKWPPLVLQTQRIGLFPKTAIKKFVGLFVALSLYHNKTKSKNSFYRQSKY